MHKPTGKILFDKSFDSVWKDPSSLGPFFISCFFLSIFYMHTAASMFVDGVHGLYDITGVIMIFKEFCKNSPVGFGEPTRAFSLSSVHIFSAPALTAMAKNWKLGLARMLGETSPLPLLVQSGQLSSDLQWVLSDLKWCHGPWPSHALHNMTKPPKLQWL